MTTLTCSPVTAAHLRFAEAHDHHAAALAARAAADAAVRQTEAILRAAAVRLPISHDQEHQHG